MQKDRASGKRKGLWATLCNAFCLLLLIFFLLQSFMVGVLLIMGELPVPPFLIDRLNQELKKEGFRFEVKNMRLDSRGYLYLERPRLVHAHSGEPIVQAEAVLLEFAVWALPAGQFLVQRVCIADGAIWLPPVYSPTGQREALVSKLYVEVEKRVDGWNIEKGIFSFEGIETSVQGIWPHRPVHFFSKANVREVKDLSIQDRLANAYRVSQRLLVARPFLRAIRDPILSLKSLPDSNGGVDWEIYAQGTGWQYEDWEVGSWSGKARGTVTPQGIFVWPSRMEVMGTHFSKLGLMEAAEGSLTLFWRPGQQDWKPHGLRAWVWRPGFERLQGTWLALNADFANYTQFDFSARIAVDQVNVLNADGILNVDEKFVRGTVSGDINPDLLWGSPFLGGLQKPEELDRFDEVHFNVDVSLKPGFELDRVSGQIYVRNLHYDGLTVLGGLLEGFWSGEEIFFSDVMLTSGTYAVEGSYWQNIRTQDFRFLLEGTVKPDDLNNIIDESWWTDLWSHFRFSDHLPSANVDLSGRYRTGGKHMHLFLSASLDKFHYKGENFNHLELYLAQNPVRILLFNAELTADDGEAIFDLQWDRDEPGAPLKSLAFRGSASVPLERAAKVIDPEVEEILEDFDFVGRNFIRANGLLFRDESEKAGERYLKIWGNIPDGLSYANYDLDSVRFLAISRPGHVLIQDLEFSLAGGPGKGKAELTNAGDSWRSLDFNLQIRDAELKRLFTTVAFLKEAAADLNDNQNANGMVDVDLDAKGIIGRMDSFKGKGYLALRDAELGSLHLFGILSRFMGSLGINFGTFSFNRATTHVDMDKGNLYFPDLLVSGSSACIEASGNLNMDNNQLDFVLTFRPFGELSIPVISQVLDLFSPLANSIVIRLSGTLKDPEFNTSFQPLRILTGQEKVSDPE